MWLGCNQQVKINGGSKSQTVRCTGRWSRLLNIADQLRQSERYGLDTVQYLTVFARKVRNISVSYRQLLMAQCMDFNKHRILKHYVFTNQKLSLSKLCESINLSKNMIYIFHAIYLFFVNSFINGSYPRYMGEILQ